MEKLNIKTGIIKESELINLYGTNAQKTSYLKKGKFVSSYKNALFNKLNRYCEIVPANKKNSKENLYQIVQVYDHPLPPNFNQMQKSIYKYLVPLVLDSLVDKHDENRKIEITANKWARNIHMINNNYNLIKYNPEDSSTELQINLNIINEFYDKTDDMINYYIANTLKYLEKAGLIIWREIKKVVKEEAEDKSIIDCDGNVLININYTTTTATDEDMKFYAQCIEVADRKANIESASERYYSHKSPLFLETLKQELYKKKIKCMYNAYQAYYIDVEKCKALLKHFQNVNTDHIIDDFNELFSDMILNNANERFDKNIIKYICASIPKEDYEKFFESLCEISIDNHTEYLGRRIRERNSDDDYKLCITHARSKKE